MEAIRLDIVVDQNGEARRILDDLEIHYLKTGKSVEDAAKQVEKFERAYKDNSAQKAATKALDDLAKGHDAVSDAAKRHASNMSVLSSAVMRFAGPAVLLAAAKSTIAWADSIQELSERTKFSTTAVQQMGKIAEQNGSSFTALAGAVQIAEQRLVDGNKKAMEAVAGMGLSVSTLLAMKPEDRLRALAVGLAEIEDPARRSAAEMAVFGRTGDALAPTLNAIASGADKAKSALGSDFISVGSQAQDLLDDMLATSKELLATFLMWPTVMTQKIGEWSKGSLLGTWAEMQGWHGAVAGPTLPGAPKGAGAWMPTPLGAPGDPFSGVGGQSWDFINRQITPKVTGRPGAMPTPITPWTMNQWAQIQTAAMWGANPLGNGGLGSFPGWAMPNPLASSMTPSLLGIGNDRLSQMVGFAPTVAMNAPGATGGSFLSKLFGGGKLTNIAAGGIGFLTQLIPGLSSKGQSIGSMVGSFLGPLGSVLGGLGGGLLGKLFGGNSDKKQLSQLRSGDEFKDLVAQANAAGISVDKLFSAKKVKDFQQAVEEVQKKLGQFTADQEADTQRLTAAMEKYGFSIADMGAKFKQVEMDKSALDMAEDFRVLVAAGADVNKVIEKMAPTLSSFVQQSIDMGTTIPNEMEPIIRKAKEMGLLFDKNGDVLSDEAYNSIKWTESMTKGFDRVVEAINRLTDAFRGMGDEVDRTTGGVQSLDRAIRDMPDPGRYTSGGPDGDPVPVSRGGLILGRGRVQYFGAGGFIPRGTDTVPAMLTPGEMVTSAGATREILKALKGQRRGEPSATFVFIPNGVRQDDILDNVWRQMPREVAGNGPLRTKLRKALVTQGVMGG